MLNYELMRAVNLDRERDIRRAVRERSLRAAPVAVEPVGEPPVLLALEEPRRGSRLAPSRLR
jgi:hypothetical protein